MKTWAKWAIALGVGAGALAVLGRGSEATQQTKSTGTPVDVRLALLQGGVPLEGGGVFVPTQASSIPGLEEPLVAQGHSEPLCWNRRVVGAWLCDVVQHAAEMAPSMGEDVDASRELVEGVRGLASMIRTRYAGSSTHNRVKIAGEYRNVFNNASMDTGLMSSDRAARLLNSLKMLPSFEVPPKDMPDEELRALEAGIISEILNLARGAAGRPDLEEQWQLNRLADYLLGLAPGPGKEQACVGEPWLTRTRPEVSIPKLPRY